MLEHEVEKLNKGVHVNLIGDAGMVQRMQEIGEKHGVVVTTIAKSGDPYTHVITEDGKTSIISSTVPEGKVYLALSSERVDIHDFWQEVRALESLDNQ